MNLARNLPHRQCLCDKCENCELMLKGIVRSSIKGIAGNLTDIIRKTMCKFVVVPYGGMEYPRLKCAKRSCQNCGVQMLLNCVKCCNSLKNIQDSCKWHRWEPVTKKIKGKVTKKLLKREKNGSGLVLLNNFFANLHKLSLHLFLARWQMNDFRQVVKNIEVGEVVIVHDFSRNYTCAVQNEVQGGNWDRKLATVHPSIMYFRCPQNDCCKTVTLEFIHIFK